MIVNEMKNKFLSVFYFQVLGYFVKKILIKVTSFLSIKVSLNYISLNKKLSHLL